MISTSRTSDFQISGSAISSHKNIQRYIFTTAWDAEYYVDDLPYAFSDELAEYTFCPYSCKLSELPEYKGNSKSFENARIYLILKEPKKLIKAPCYVWEDLSRIYMTDLHFNKYWRYISKRLCEGYRRSDPKMMIFQHDMNNQVDLSRMETPFRTAKIGEGYTIEFEGREVDLEMQRMISKQAQAMDDYKIRYVYSQKDNLVHDKTCSQVEKIHYTKFEASETFPEAREICPLCKRYVHIRSMLGADNVKHFQWYTRILGNGRVSTKMIETLAVTKQAKLFMPAPDLLEVTCGEDTWQIVEGEDHKCTLYHNNYVRINETERHITSGFHQQMKFPLALSILLQYIEGYDWNKHVEFKSKEATIKDNPVDEKASTIKGETILADNENKIKGCNGKTLWRRILSWVEKLIAGKKK